MTTKRARRQVVLALLALAPLALASAGCSQLKLEPARNLIQRKGVVRIVVREDPGEQIKFLILNLGDEPLRVDYDKIVIRGFFGDFKRSRPTGWTYTVPPRGSRLITLSLGSHGFKKNDQVDVLFEGAIFRGDKAVRLDPFEFLVKSPGKGMH